MITEMLKTMNPEARAKILMHVDDYLRDNLTDEGLFELWLEEGVPDGTRSWEELVDMEAEDFVKMMNLASLLMRQHLVDKEEGWI